jgi:hypothetical protein
MGMHWHWFIGPVVVVGWAALFFLGVYLVMRAHQPHH